MDLLSLNSGILYQKRTQDDNVVCFCGNGRLKADPQPKTYGFSRGRCAHHDDTKITKARGENKWGGVRDTRTGLTLVFLVSFVLTGTAREVAHPCGRQVEAGANRSTAGGVGHLFSGAPVSRSS